MGKGRTPSRHQASRRTATPSSITRGWAAAEVGTTTRRGLLWAIAVGALAWPLVARSQPRVPIRRVGVLVPYTESTILGSDVVDVLRKELGRRGWVEGRTLRLNARRKLGDPTQVRTEAQALAKWEPHVILCANAVLLRAAMRESDTIPIVFVQVADPVGQNFVKSVTRPGANVTGISNYDFGMPERWLGTLRDLVPGLKRVALIYNADSALANPFFVRAFEAATRSSRIMLGTTSLRAAADIQATMEGLAAEPGGGFVVLPDPFTIAHRSQIIAAAARSKVPGLYPFRHFATAGGLCSYGVDVREAYQLGADYIDRILKGEKPAEMPIYRPEKYQLVVNLKAARALKLSVPSAVIGRADEFIR